MPLKQTFITHKTAVITLIISIAFLGFELFNFDTTRYALDHLMRGRTFLGLEWAAILAFAFGSIDLAGLVRVFTPEQDLKDEPLEIWLMVGAWFIGTCLNATMTWYTMTLVIAPLGVDAATMPSIHNTVLYYAPLFIAFLVWLTRVTLISSIALTLDRLAAPQNQQQPNSSRATKSLGLPTRRPVRQALAEDALFAVNGHTE